MRRTIWLVTLGVAAFGLGSGPWGVRIAGASDASLPEVGAWEVGFQSAYSFGFTNNAQMVTLLPRVGRVIAVGRGRKPRVVSFGFEGMFSHVFETSQATEIGGGLFLRSYLASWRVQPYAEIAGGVLYSDLRRFDLSARALFAVHGALGLQVPIGRELAMTAGYRFRHISNAGQSRNNPGLNSNLLSAGIAYVY